MSLGNEILTLQFGHYSNYIGAHWLNIQEAGFSFNPDFLPEVKHDILFREGLSANGAFTYTPRLLLVDFKKSLGHLETPSDFDTVRETINWDCDKVENLTESETDYVSNDYLKDVEASKNEPIPLLKSSYDLDGAVSTWSDYLASSLHSRSVNVINGYQLGINDDEFCCYSLGVDTWQDVYFRDDFTDSIRRYVEECDNIQGFHVLADANNGFCGLSSKCLEYLKDEYDKKSIFCVPSYNGCVQGKTDNTRKQNLYYILNLMAGMSHFIEFSDLIAPVSVYTNVVKRPLLSRNYKNLVYEPKSAYHSSAIIATALDSITLPYRTRDSFSRMDDVIRAVTIHNRTVATVGINFPFPMVNEDKLFDILEKWDDKWFESLTPEIEIDMDRVISQLVTARGIDNDALYRSVGNASGDANPAAACKTAEEMFDLFFKFSFDYSKSSVKAYSSTFRVPSTYPRLFNTDYDLTFSLENPWGRLAELRLLASLHCTPETQNLLHEILSPSRSKTIERLATATGIVPTDFYEMQENIERTISCYNDSSWTL